MRRKLLALLAATVLSLGGGMAMVQPAAAESVPLGAGCTLVVRPGTTSAECTFVGVGTVGSYQIVVTGASVTLAITCNGYLRAYASTSVTVSGSYLRPYLTNSCHAKLTMSGWGGYAVVTVD